MKTKKIILSCSLIAVASLGIFVASNFVQADNDNLENTAFQSNKVSSSEVKTTSENKESNLAIKVALNDFASLEEFDEHFQSGAGPLIDNGDGTSTAPPITDEQWMVPDTTPEGSNDGGKTHGWSMVESREKAHDQEIKDINTGKVTDVIKASDGATVGDIRKALSDRDAAK